VREVAGYAEPAAWSRSKKREKVRKRKWREVRGGRWGMVEGGEVGREIWAKGE